MTSFMDRDAPNTAWRPGTEGAIPVALGRWAKTAFLYRLAAGRPLDGIARTNATFRRAGTKDFTRNANARPFDFWPGWKRGLYITRLPVLWGGYAGVVGVNEWLDIGGGYWWHAGGPSTVAAPWVGLVGWRTTLYVQRRQFDRAYIQPIQSAARTALRTSENITVELDREFPKASKPGPTGRLYLPRDFVGADADKDNLIEIVRTRTGNELVNASFELEGMTPYIGLSIAAVPPAKVTWETMLEKANPVTPYLGQSAQTEVFWNPEGGEPHIAIIGKTGTGKSELMSFIVAQYMRGGGGVLVIDRKGFSHEWLKDVPEVAYARSAKECHDALVWLEQETQRRIDLRVAGVQRVFPRLMVVLEERNTLEQDLADFWNANKPTGWKGLAPGKRAIRAVMSMARAVQINVVMAGQESAQMHIGPKTNYGAFLMAAKMEANHWRNAGMQVKPGISAAAPGRWGRIVSGDCTVFQAAFPDLEQKERFDGNARLLEYALGGDSPLNVRELLTQAAIVTLPSSEVVSVSDDAGETVTLGEYAAVRPYTLAKLRTDRGRADANYPTAVSTVGAHRYNTADLDAFYGITDEDEEEELS